MLIVNFYTLLRFAVAKSIRRVLHWYLHAGAVPEAGHVRAAPPRGCLPAVRLQRA